jgi:hypothetical protein
MKKNTNILKEIKKYKKGLIVLLIALLSVGGYVIYNDYFSKEAINAKYFTFDSTTGTIINYAYDSPKDVVIPSEIRGVPVRIIGENAFILQKLKSVVIPSSVTRIETMAFASNKLTSVTIPNSVTYIGELAFLENLLTNVEIPSSVTKIELGAFNRNSLPNEQAFIYKRNSDGSIDYTTIVSYGGIDKNVVVPDGVTTIEQEAFTPCLIESVEIPASVTDIQYGAFSRNPITSVTIKGDNPQRFNEEWDSIGFDAVSRP